MRGGDNRRRLQVCVMLAQDVSHMRDTEPSSADQERVDNRSFLRHMLDASLESFERGSERERLSKRISCQKVQGMQGLPSENARRRIVQLGALRRLQEGGLLGPLQGHRSARASQSQEGHQKTVHEMRGTSRIKRLYFAVRLRLGSVSVRLYRLRGLLACSSLLAI